MAIEAPPAALDQGYGYGIVLGLGMGIGVMMYGVTFLEKRYMQANLANSESYMTGDRSIKTGLVAAAVVSSWTWAATLLQSSSVAYKYGVSGSFWYAAGATVQVLLFATLAIELKRVAPNAHTFLEIVRVRYGKAAHILYICFSFTTNMIVTSMLLLGGSATITYLTGMDVNAACMLLPVGVIMYTSVGGIKATFLMDYTHTCILFVVIIVFTMNVYAVNPKIGSIDKMFDLLTIAGELQPQPNNAKGSYITMASNDGIIFGVINIVGNFGTVFVDNAYWQRAIAAHPKYCVNAYLLGGLSWFAVPFTLATTMGLAGRALLLNTTPGDVSAGLVLPQAATALLGKGGAVMALLIVFFAVTSSLSAEMVAVSSVMTYDIYQTYIDPAATNKQIKRVADTAICSYGLFAGVLAIVLNNIGITIGYLYLLMGIIITGAVVPLACTMLWKKQNWYAVMLAPIIAQWSAIIAWLVCTRVLYNDINLDNTGMNFPMVAGNVVALFMPMPIVYFVSMMAPDDFDFTVTQLGIDKVVEIEEAVEIKDTSEEEVNEQELRASSRYAKIAGTTLAFGMLILWPLPLFFSDYVFSLVFFRGWVVFSIMWVYVSACFITLFPLYESRESLGNLFMSIINDLSGNHPEPVEKIQKSLDKTAHNGSMESMDGLQDIIIK